MKILLHACCGPCSLEPVRLLSEEGNEIALFYANSNIHPQSEYAHRRDTLRAWADAEGIEVIEGIYDPDSWSVAVGSAESWGADHRERCRACYRLRLAEAAAYAQAHGFDALSTTLSVSPYQFTEVIDEEVRRAAETAGLIPVFRDFRANYPEATRRSRSLGMYRQNYCGCVFSDAEEAAEREEAKRKRAREKAERQARNAGKRAAEEAERAAKKEQRATYEAKQHAKRLARDAARRAAKDGSSH